MSYKDLLVHVDSSENCAERLALAVALARRFGAHLSGLHVAPSLAISPFIADQFPDSVLETAHVRIAQQRDNAKAAFAAASAELGTNAEWLEARGDAAEAIRFFVRHADLAILGQVNPDAGGDAAASQLPEHILMGSGRPVLIVPYVGRFATVGERVLVAWNGSAQVARAVNDALPLLKGAKRVVILTAKPAHGGRVDGADIARHLAWHGVSAEISGIAAAESDVGDLLLSRATDEAADLIVMGGYGHSRMRELVLGGVSRDLLAHMTVPVLMAH
jgi:nucleotide-binding universal stress UspA family protein